MLPHKLESNNNFKNALKD